MRPAATALRAARRYIVGMLRFTTTSVLYALSRRRKGPMTEDSQPLSPNGSRSRKTAIPHKPTNLGEKFVSSPVDEDHFLLLNETEKDVRQLVTMLLFAVHEDGLVAVSHTTAQPPGR